jgi:SAM-dependent methyltransferase
MKVFDAYARYYDLLYQQKDYAQEAAFVAAALRRYIPACARVLDLGCGTGRHAAHLAEFGFSVTGVDRSAEMLAVANAHRADLASHISAQLNFVEGDARGIRLGEQFDAVVALFHVVSYQRTDKDVAELLATAHAHLKPGGVFVFDVWHGPAVLNVGPSVRVARFADARTRVLRVAEPCLFPQENVVEVNYEIITEDIATGAVQTIKEVHPMRYFFAPEVGRFCRDAGFAMHGPWEWLTEREPELDTWSAYYAATLM